MKSEEVLQLRRFYAIIHIGGEYYAQRENKYRDPDARWYSYGSYPSWQREFTWYELKLKIRYYVSRIPYEKIIDIQSRTKDIKAIVLYYERKNPENIIDLHFAENWRG